MKSTKTTDEIIIIEWQLSIILSISFSGVMSRDISNEYRSIILYSHVRFCVIRFIIGSLSEFVVPFIIIVFIIITLISQLYNYYITHYDLCK